MGDCAIRWPTPAKTCVKAVGVLQQCFIKFSCGVLGVFFVSGGAVLTHNIRDESAKMNVQTPEGSIWEFEIGR
eukprot:8316383-Lingulodinium_polyedra.AAC.1